MKSIKPTFVFSESIRRDPGYFGAHQLMAKAETPWGKVDHSTIFDGKMTNKKRAQFARETENALYRFLIMRINKRRKQQKLSLFMTELFSKVKKRAKK